MASTNTRTVPATKDARLEKMISALYFMSIVGLLATCSMLAACRGSLAEMDDASEDAETPAGLVVFDNTTVHTVDVTLSSQDWQAIIDEAAIYENTNPDRPYYRAQARFDGKALDGDIGIRLKGHISIELSDGHSFPLKLDFNRYVDDLTLDGLKKLNLNTNFSGPTLPIIRDYVAYEAWRDFGVAASRTSLARVTVNDEDLGVYTLLEQVDGGFLDRHFDEPRGDLYKPEQKSGMLEYRGSRIEEYPEIGHKWPDKTNHASLLHALFVLDTGSVSEIEEVLDAESILTYLAGNVALGSWDYYPNTGHNYYLYEQTPGRFIMLPWDMNGALEVHEPELCSPMHAPLSRRLFENPRNQTRYFEIVEEFLATAGSLSQISARLNAAESLLGTSFSPDGFERLRQETILRIERVGSELRSTTTCR